MKHCGTQIIEDGSVEIGYGISEINQGNGYATEAVNAVVTWALKQPGVLRVEAETEPDNRASQRVLEKCGFYPIGDYWRRRASFLQNLLTYSGSLTYSVLNLVAIGEKGETKKAYTDADLHTENVHYENFKNTAEDAYTG